MKYGCVLYAIPPPSPITTPSRSWVHRPSPQLTSALAGRHHRAQSFLQTFVMVQEMLSNAEPSFTLLLSIGTSFVTLGASLATLGQATSPPHASVFDAGYTRVCCSRVVCCMCGDGTRMMTRWRQIVRGHGGDAAALPP